MGRLKQVASRLRPVEQNRIAVKHSLKTAEKRMRGRGWQALRETVLLRDQYQCRQCGRVVLPSDAECDHIVPLADGGKLANALQRLSLGKICFGKSPAKSSLVGWGYQKFIGISSGNPPPSHAYILLVFWCFS